MKRDEKNQMMRRRIMDSALLEFSAQGYAGSSINTICAAQDISKGIVYHYFETKDALYLACVEECFTRLTGYIMAQTACGGASIDSQLKRYFTLRTDFFRAHPVYQRIFCEAVISPPAHLKEGVQRCREDFDALNVQMIRQLLAPVSLRCDLSEEDVIEIFRQFQDFVNIRCQMAAPDSQTFESREESCLKALSVLLYGVIERKEHEHAEQ